ncbi:MAG: protein-S-isoprenylcysteine O-methyltransferase [Bacteroidota bacterium]
MDPLILKIVYCLSIVASVIIRRPHEKRNKENKIVNDQKSTQEKLLLLVVWVGMMILPVLYMFTGLLGFADYTLPLGLHIVGVLVMSAAMWLFYRSHKDLGRNWSVSLEIREEHQLISSGVYRFIRHPMYTAIWLWVIGQALLLNNYIAGLSGLVCFGLLYFFRVGQEEKMMAATFGEAYEKYKLKTGRLWPRVRSLST